MNIFLLDKNLRICAQEHADKHVVKMILEYAQILCTVLHLNDIPAPYKPTHTKHPCIIWCNKSRENWLMLHKLCELLNKEYRFRYSKEYDHKSWTTVKNLSVPESLPSIGITKLAQAMPEEYKNKNTVTAYRNYYLGEKRHLAKWTNRDTPKWYK